MRRLSVGLLTLVAIIGLQTALIAPQSCVYLWYGMPKAPKSILK